jgi:drug/metabolite transporter (DMT)-like permease
LLTKQAQIKREKTKEDLRPFLTIQGQASALGAFPVDSILVLLFGAFLWGVSTVFYKKFLTRVDPFVTHFVQLAVGSVFLCVWVFGTGGFVVSADMTYVGLLIVSSPGALAAGNVVWLYLLKREEATTLSGSSLIIPAMALLFGWWILGESLDSVSVLGCALTLVGVCLVNLRRKNSAAPVGRDKV